jgi:hypothetical protein
LSSLILARLNSFHTTWTGRCLATRRTHSAVRQAHGHIGSVQKLSVTASAIAPSTLEIFSGVNRSHVGT